MLTCLKYEMFFEFKNEAKSKETTTSLKEKYKFLLKKIFEDDEDSEIQIVHEKYDEGPNDEGNTIKLSDPFASPQIENYEELLFSLF